MVWVWVAGLRFLWRSGAPMWRALVCAYGLLYLVFALTTGEQVYYLGGGYVTLLAAGAVSVDGWLHQRPARLRVLAAATVVTTAIFTADYSEAAAINELGRGTGLPTAVSG